MTKRVVIIDTLNLFIRNYIVNPTLTNNGDPAGGLAGSLRSIQKVVEDTRPDMIICVWDGAGGSLKRRSQNKNYKDGRKPIRVNRAFKILDEPEELENKVWQQTRLLEYLNQLPIIQFVFDKIEADDIIGVLARHSYFQEWQKVIVSSDKDFIQLCDAKTILYRPTQNEVLTVKSALIKYNIHPNNFCLARSISGDKSDNLDGVGGIQLKTAANRFPFLAEEKPHTINDLIEYSKKQIEENKKAPKAYGKVAENEDLIKENYGLMQLFAPTVGYDVKSKIDYVLENFEPTLNRTYFIQYCSTDGFAEINFEILFRHMQRVVSNYKEAKQV